MADEDPDDPQLKALRAVWLAMRDSDEDPPDSGVSALMAAARSQASMMAAARAPWWKRLFDQLRRPPVLALASLLVVIGVGVLLASHHDALEKAPTRAPVQEKELPHANLDIGGPAPATAAAPAPAPDLDKAKVSDQKAHEEAPVHRHPTSPAHAPEGNGMPAPRTAPRPEPAFEAGDAVTAGAKTETAAPANPQPGRILVDELAAQVRRAAKRGDCENARAIATRIAGQDAAYYRDHVAGDLASCVASSAPGSAAADAAH